MRPFAESNVDQYIHLTLADGTTACRAENVLMSAVASVFPLSDKDERCPICTSIYLRQMRTTHLPKTKKITST
jgi:hypothetical protein